MRGLLPESAALAHKTTLVLRNIPRTALVSDVRRFLSKNQVENVQDVFLDYIRFLPTGKAYVTFTTPNFVHPAFLRLKTAQMSGLPLDVTTTGPLEIKRSRGVKGRADAMARGALSGNGADAGVDERGKNVVIWGLPGKMTTDQLRTFLRNYKLVRTGNGEDDILKLPAEGRPTLTSRHYVRTVSATEAHRMVRRIHMSPFESGARHYIMRARVVY